MLYKISGRRLALSIFKKCVFSRFLTINEQKSTPLTDRKELDDIVFDALGLTEDKCKQVYWAVAELYGVETKILNQAVKRNIERFPEDFMFQLSKEELELWRSQIVISNPSAKMALRRKPYAFTVYGISMLSSVLNSPRAININIQIMRVFINYAMQLSLHDELRKTILKLEIKHDVDIEQLYSILFHEVDRLESLMIKIKKQIGFKSNLR